MLTIDNPSPSTVIVVIMKSWVDEFNRVNPITTYYNYTARPWGLPGLVTSVQASHDDDDDDDDDCMVNCSMGPGDFVIFLKPIRNSSMTVRLIVPWGRGTLISSWNPIRNSSMIVWLIVPWGRGTLISSWIRIRNPHDCRVNSMWYVEATCSGYMICRSTTCSGQHPSNIIEHKTLPVVWRLVFTLFWVWANLEVCV